VTSDKSIPGLKHSDTYPKQDRHGVKPSIGQILPVGIVHIKNIQITMWPWRWPMIFNGPQKIFKVLLRLT